jgi:hypothetical protein
MMKLKRYAILIPVLLLVAVGIYEAVRRETPSIDVEVEQAPLDAPRAALAPGENHVEVSQGQSFFLGMETSRHVGCGARTRDPEVLGLRLELFRVDAAGPTLVARTKVVPGVGHIYFEYDALDDPLGTEFLLRGHFHYPEDRVEVDAREITLNDPARRR